MPRKGYRAPLLAVAALFAVTSAAAIVTDRFDYDAAQVGYFSISPMHLAPDSDINGYFIDYSVMQIDAANGCYHTGVNLPQGALIASVQSWYTSDNQSNPVFVMYRHNLATGGYDELVYGPVSDDSDVRTSVTHNVAGPLRQVKNGQYSYAYVACLDSGSQFQGARIRYTYASAGD